MQHGYRSNQLLAALPTEEADRLLARSRLEQLDARQLIFEPYERLETVYFPLSGMCSLLTTMLNGDTIEMATIGHEGNGGRSHDHGMRNRRQHARHVPGGR